MLKLPISAPDHPRLSRTPHRLRSGFTLVEMLLVLVILAVLAAIVIPKMSGRTQQAKIVAAQQQISSLSLALDAFEVDNGYYPTGANGLNALMQPPNNSPGWHGPYLPKAVPADPWGNPYIYTCPGKNSAAGYDLMSMGPDGRAGGDDDITNWDNKR
jgi:general secretion pathway protein G